MTNKTRFKLFQCDHIICIYSKPSKFLPSSPLKPNYITFPKETLICVCRFDITSYIRYELKNGNTFLCI